MICPSCGGLNVRGVTVCAKCNRYLRYFADPISPDGSTIVSRGIEDEDVDPIRTIEDAEEDSAEKEESEDNEPQDGDVHSDSPPVQTTDR